MTGSMHNRFSLACLPVILAAGLSATGAAHAGGAPRGGGIYVPPQRTNHVQDHRGPNLGGAASSGTHIRCVIFCGNSFTPRGAPARPHTQDHRGGIAIVNENGARTGTANVNPAVANANRGPRIVIVDRNGNRVGTAPAPRATSPGRPVLVDSFGRRLHADRTPYRPHEPGYQSPYGGPNSARTAGSGYPAPAGNNHPNHMPHLLAQ